MASDASPPARADRRRATRPAGLPGTVAGAFADYEKGLAQPGGSLDANTVRVYTSRVRHYLAWLAAALDDGTVDGDPITDPDARDRAVRDYRAHLRTVAQRKPATINAHLTAIDDFYRRRGPGPAAAERVDIPPATPQVLGRREQLRLLRAADRAPLRDRAIAFTAFYAGTLLRETANLDTGDVHIPVRDADLDAHLRIRHARDGTFRDIPLHPKLRAVLREWISERARWKGADTSTALFLNRRGGRLSARSVYTVLRAIADAADLPLGRDGLFTPRVLRHTAATTMAQEGADVIVVAELLGQSAETARRYRQSSRHDRQKAIERLPTNE